MLRSRGQRIVAAIAHQLTKPKIVAAVANQLAQPEKTLLDHLKKSARLPGLPTMVQRNGLLQTLAFLDTKAKDGQGTTADGHLVALLRAVLVEVGPSGLAGDLSSAGLAKLDARRYLLLQELAIDVAAWTYRLVEAQR